MLQGYRTYIALIAGLIFNVLQSMGIINVPSNDIEYAINIIILIIAGLFRYYATRKTR